MRMLAHKAFTLFELVVVIAVVGMVSSLVIRGTYTYLQEQHLRQAANELLGYLLSARARAQREASVTGRACEVQLNAATNIIEPTTQAANICDDEPALPSLNLLAASGSSNLAITSNQGSSPYLITFTRYGTVASSNLSSDTAISFPLVIYFANAATENQRCVMINLNSFSIGWRNSSKTENCTYNNY